MQDVSGLSEERREDEAAAGGGEPDRQRSLASRVPGQHAIAQLLSVRSSERPRSRWARIFGASPIGAESEPAFVSALGELRVGELLGELGADWVVLHAVPVGDDGTDINHLVVGPAGIFTITTRNHPGQPIDVSGRSILVGGIKLAHIRSAEHDLGRAERRLAHSLDETVRVRALLVFVDPAALELRATPRDVHVLSSADLVQWLRTQPRVLSDAEIERIARVAERPQTWGIAAELDDEGARGELDRLARLVARSRRLREFWLGAATILIVVSVTAFATLAVIRALGGGAH